MKLLHWHDDPDWQIDGANAYYQCRCGARRTVHYYRRMGSPTRPDWPALIDRHGRSIEDSRWQRAEATS